MIIIKSKQEIDMMRTAGKVNSLILRELKNIIKPGISTMDIDQFVEKTVKEHGMIASEKGYCDYPASACVSVNEEVVHGIPSKKRILQEGDIVSVDLVVEYKGYMADAARTYGVGEISSEAKRLIDTAEAAFFEGIKFAREGYRLYDISHAIQQKVEGEGFGVIRDFVGHGIGSEMHEEPQIPNYGKAGKGPRLQTGMTLAIEPMIVEGSYEVDVLQDDWTVVTVDGGLAAHYENTVVINDGEPELLTL
ncbi:MAG: type I methionyl aminopeptidase [Emergencia timonensis]|uniref:type I methionyl aminopeptidase n=1 Tax=Emergencia timonensis TaxID=1776384 RepID=UPI00082FE8CE|nr:type I methionyl aminopeptidase [Emergencia timonensis]WNX88486.1 type I methionyl aminopeptidase [Emergencia timonensis]